MNGVVITGVSPNSQPADKGITAGDVVVKIHNSSSNLEAVASADELSKRIAQLKSTGQKSVLLIIANSEGTRFVALHF